MPRAAAALRGAGGRHALARLGHAVRAHAATLPARQCEAQLYYTTRSIDFAWQRKVF